jgi:hypothetical protein
MDLKASLPDGTFIAKTAIAMVAIFFVVKMLPTTWNIAKWFQPV